MWRHLKAHFYRALGFSPVPETPALFLPAWVCAQLSTNLPTDPKPRRKGSPRERLPGTKNLWGMGRKAGGTRSLRAPLRQQGLGWGWMRSPVLVASAGTGHLSWGPADPQRWLLPLSVWFYSCFHTRSPSPLSHKSSITSSTSRSTENSSREMTEQRWDGLSANSCGKWGCETARKETAL